MSFWARYLACSLITRVALGDSSASLVVSGPNVQGMNITQELQLCTVDEVLSTDDYRLSDGWTDVMIEVMPYNCSCGMPRARYFCPSARDREYPMWEVPQAHEGKCEVISREKLVEEPFPRGFNILVYGNSHLRQVVEGIMCISSGALVARDVLYNGKVKTVGAATQCRGCVSGLEELEALMVEYSCVDPEIVNEACRCSDDSSVFRFANGATLHYFFPGGQAKTIDQALGAQRLGIHYFDVVFANAGNSPVMTAEAMLASAEATHRAGVAFFWLTTYDSVGDLDVFLTSDQKSTFQSLGARFVDIGNMVRDVQKYTKGNVMGGNDPHYCMPGPTNEISLLLMQLAWLEWYGGFEA